MVSLTTGRACSQAVLCRQRYEAELLHVSRSIAPESGRLSLSPATVSSNVSTLGKIKSTGRAPLRQDQPEDLTFAKETKRLRLYWSYEEGDAFGLAFLTRELCTTSLVIALGPITDLRTKFSRTVFRSSHLSKSSNGLLGTKNFERSRFRGG